MTLMHDSPSPALPRPQVIIFDVDGTLVDISGSFRAAAPLAAARYLALIGLTPPPMTGEVYDHFKLMGGFNDDWDLTAGLLRALLAPLPPVQPMPVHPWADGEALLAALRLAAAPLAGFPLPLPDLQTLIPPVQAAGGGLAGLAQVIGRRNAELVRRSGPAASSDLVQRIFAEIYLGETLFAAGYGFPARYQHGPGLIETERPIVSPDTLAALARSAHLGIATGRTRFELSHPWQQMGWGRFFATAATMTDALEAQIPGGPSLLKPHPYLLQRAAAALDPSGRLTAAYIGDAPDDVVAARRADGAGRRWLSIALAPDPAPAAHIRALGADLILSCADELPAALERMK